MSLGLTQLSRKLARKRDEARDTIPAPLHFSSSQESPNLREGSICILRWIQSLGSNVHIWALHRGFVGEMGGLMALGPQLWSSALALPQTPWSLCTALLSSSMAE